MLADTELLSKFEIMDYSLLVGIHTSEETEHPDGRGALSNNSDLGRNVCHISSPEDQKNEIYFVGIIDTLTCYNLQKKIANVVKRISYKNQELSTVPADMYCERFRNFVQRIIN